MAEVLLLPHRGDPVIAHVEPGEVLLPESARPVPPASRNPYGSEGAETTAVGSWW